MTIRWWTRLVLEVAVVFALLVVAKVTRVAMDRRRREAQAAENEKQKAA